MQSADFVATLFDGRANPAKVTVAFTMALNALQKEHSARVLLLVAAAGAVGAAILVYTAQSLLRRQGAKP